jgi:HD-GYP domain-containing protein (c-di-GMP phosphodiesterase class II)
MLVHIAVTGDDEALLRAMQTTFEGYPVRVSPLRKDATPIPLTTGIVTAPETALTLLEPCLALARFESNLFRLLAQAIDAHEGLPPTAHVEMLDVALGFAEFLEMSPQERQYLELSVLFHDLGKIRVPAEVFVCKTLLSAEEWEQVRRHAEWGAEMLEAQGFPCEVSAVVRHHHESYDGTGYPEGLEGEAIPRLARILRIIDVYTAITTPRKYRRSVSTKAEAIEQLQTEDARSFDPVLVSKFVSYLTLR